MIRPVRQCTNPPVRSAVGRPHPRAIHRLPVLSAPAAVLFLFLFLALGQLPAGAATTPPPAPSSGGGAAGPTLQLDADKVTAGQSIKITGTGWTPNSLVNMAMCGQNAQGGSNTCAVAHGVQAPVSAAGTITATLKAAMPPVPCPCVLRAVTATGPSKPQEHNVPIQIEGAAVAPLPADAQGPGRLVFLTSRMVGQDTVFTWFGSPVTRRFEIEVGNMGQSPIVNPKFRVATFEGVYAPKWREWTYQGVIAPAQRVVIRIPIELASRQHGSFSYRVMYGEQVVDEHALHVKRPWGVYLFGALLLVVVPMTVWRLGSNLVGAIVMHRKERDAERNRDVGLPLGSGIKGDSSGTAAKPSAAVPPDRGEMAVQRPLEPAMAPGGGWAPLRVESAGQVRGPLFADDARSTAGERSEDIGDGPAGSDNSGRGSAGTPGEREGEA